MYKKILCIPKILATLSTETLCINFYKNGLLGYILGDFLTKSSGHPVLDWEK
jgi:hypothetical protein